MMEVVVLRWGHRLRDERLTSHLLLTARAFGCSGIVVSEVNDSGNFGSAVRPSIVLIFDFKELSPNPVLAEIIR